MKLKSKSGSIKIIVIILIVAVLAIAATRFNVNKKVVSTSMFLEKKEQIPYEYFVLYSKDNKAGVIDKNGKIIVEPKYSDVFIPNQSKDVFFCLYDEDNSIVLNKNSEQIFKDYEEVNYFETSEPTELILEKNVLRYKKDNLYGLLGIDGEILTEAIYERMTSLKNKPGNILVKKDGLCGVINEKGETIIQVKYDNIVGDEYCLEDYGYGRTGYIVSVKNDTGVMYGYIDYTGHDMLKTSYETITRVLEYDNVNDIYIVVRSNGKKGVFKNGKQTIDFNFQSINYVDKSNVFIVEKFGKYGFFDVDGNEILPVKYNSYAIAGNYISVQDGESHLLYDLNGNLLNKDKYKSMIEVENSEYFIAITEDGFYNIISKGFQTTGKYKYIDYAFDNYFTFINEEGKSGIIDAANGRITVEPSYTSIISVENSKVIEARNDELGNVDIYNSKLEKVSTLGGGIVEKVDDDYIVAYSESERLYFNKYGEIVPNMEVYPTNNIYADKQNEKWGFLNKDGKVILDCIYDMVTEIDEYGFAGIKQNGKWGVVDNKGEIIVQPSYEIDTYYFPKFVGKYLLELTETKHCVEL